MTPAERARAWRERQGDALREMERVRDRGRYAASKEAGEVPRELMAYRLGRTSYWRPKTRKCVFCGIEFVVPRGWRKTCSDVCRGLRETHLRRRERLTLSADQKAARKKSEKKRKKRRLDRLLAMERALIELGVDLKQLQVGG